MEAAGVQATPGPVRAGVAEPTGIFMPANHDEPPGWQDMCRESGINPDEVRLIHERYAAYRQFTNEGTADQIPLERWFRFYHLEKTSEGIQAGAPSEGCSADGDAVNDACLKRPAEFLRVLLAFDRSRPANYGSGGGSTG